MKLLKDKFGRPLRDLRISVTDRCNFRCSYCMPREIFGQEYNFLPKSELLTFEEITRLAKIFVSQGVTKIRITGGEPLLRKDIEILIQMLAEIENVDLTLTTNGSLLERKAKSLKDAGLNRITVSLDSLDDATFTAMNDVAFPVEKILSGINAAKRVGLSPIKINMVVKKGVNDQDILPMARFFKGSGHIVRYIEFMDVGTSNNWRLDDVVPASKIVEMIDKEMKITAVNPNYQGEVANRYRYSDGSGEIGIISSVSKPFCGNCTRLRLSAKGQLFTCLFGKDGYDLRSVLRSNDENKNVEKEIKSLWRKRDDRYSELRDPASLSSDKVEMSYIGG